MTVQSVLSPGANGQGIADMYNLESTRRPGGRRGDRRAMGEHSVAKKVHLTAAECAELIGVAELTWRSYVLRGQAPASIGHDPATGLMIWDAAVVKDWHKKRPGKGNRTKGPRGRKAAAG